MKVYTGKTLSKQEIELYLSHCKECDEFVRMHGETPKSEERKAQLNTMLDNKHKIFVAICKK